jgi:hypothetical protein
MQEVIDKQRQEFPIDDSKNNHILYLQNQAVEIDGVIFHGSTMYTDFGKHHAETITNPEEKAAALQIVESNKNISTSIHTDFRLTPVNKDS